MANHLVKANGHPLYTKLLVVPVMILFQKDYARFPTAIVDTKTRNETFLRLAELYRHMGIKNAFFHLTLLQPELQGVDPFSPTLTLEQKMKIGVECRYNPWYFFREVLRIPPQSGQWPVPFRANRGNIAMFWLFFNHIDMCLIQPRQTGKSVSSDGLNTYIMHVGAVNTKVNLLTKDDTLRVGNVERLKAIRDLLPAYLNPFTKADSDNKMELTCAKLNNKLITAVSQKSENEANKVGRGLTSPICIIDEGPFVEFMDVIIPAMLSSGNAARDEAARAGALFGNIFTTTAGKLDTRSGRYMYDMIFGGMTWTEHLFDVVDYPSLRQVVAKASGDGRRKPIVNITMSHRQLGYTDEWLREKLLNSNSTGEAADRDYFNRWTAGGLQSPLPTSLNELIRGSQKELAHAEITPDYYMLRWYIPKEDIPGYMAGRHFVLGTDTSDAVGRDACTLVLQDVETLEVVAAANINEANLIRLAGFVADFMIRYKNVTMIPERRGSGQTFIDTLLVRLPAAGIDPFKRIFNLIVDESETRREDFKEIQTDLARRTSGMYDRYKKYFGFATSGSGKFSRTTLYSDILLQAAKLGGRCVHDKPLIDEITSLMVKNGRIDHSDDGHDDMVIAWMLNCWLLINGKNLKYYGIERQLTRVREFRGEDKERADYDPYQEKLAEEQQQLRQQISTLLEELRKTNDEFASMKLEARIKMLDAQLSDQYDAESSIDALIQEAGNQRSRRVRDDLRRRGQLNSPLDPLRRQGAYRTFR